MKKVDKMKKQTLSEEFLKMQMRSVIITEGEYKAKLKEYGMTNLEDEDIQDIKDIISLLRQAAEKADRVEMEDFAFKLRKDSTEIEADLNNIMTTL